MLVQCTKKRQEKQTSMRTLALSRAQVISLRLAIRKVRRSAKVAECVWNASLVMVLLAGMNESVTLLVGSVLLLAGATRHRNKVEKMDK